MISTLINSFKINNTYFTNTIIYRLREFPLIKKIFPSTLYKNTGIKNSIHILSALLKTIWSFFTKFLYLYCMIIIPLGLLQQNTANNFIHVFIFLSLVGTFSNTEMFNPTKYKYYSVILMKVDAKKYALSSFLFFILKTYITFIPAMIWVCISYDMSLYIAFLLPWIPILLKPIGARILLTYFKKKNKMLSENNIGFICIISIIVLSIMSILLYSDNLLTINSVYIMEILLTLPSTLCLISLLKDTQYKKLYKMMLTLNSIIFDINETNIKNIQKE